MSQDARVRALTEKHANLEAVIANETGRPSPDTLRIAELKRRKLRLKEEIDTRVAH